MYAGESLMMTGTRDPLAAHIEVHRMTGRDRGAAGAQWDPAGRSHRPGEQRGQEGSDEVRRWDRSNRTSWKQARYTYGRWSPALQHRVLQRSHGAHLPHWKRCRVRNRTVQRQCSWFASEDKVEDCRAGSSVRMSRSTGDAAGRNCGNRVRIPSPDPQI